MDKRIYELTEQASYLSTLKLVVDNEDFAEPKYITAVNILADAVSEYEAADTAIRTGAGLQSDGSLLADPNSSFLTSSDFTSAGYAQNLRNALRLLDAAIQGVQAQSYYRVSIDVTSAELQAISTTPKTLISVVNADDYINVVDITGFIDWNTTAYNEANNLIIQYATSDEEIGQITSDLITATSDKLYKGALTANHEIKIGEDIELTAAANYTLGDSPIKVGLTYELLDGGDLSVAIKADCCVTAMSASFTNASLADNKLVVNHALGTTDVIAVVMNSENAVETVSQTLGDATGADETNYITFDFGGAITGTWKYVIFNKNA